MQNKLVAVIGPTAAGKTTLGVKLALKFNGEILSADSRQVYKFMDIGTGKDIADYNFEGKQVSYHLVDIVHPSEEFNLYLFKKLFIREYSDITGRGKLPIMVGGTGMYISSVIQDYQLPEGDHSSASYEKLNKLTEDELREMVMDIKPRHNRTDLANKDRMIKALLHSSGEKLVSKKFNSCVIGVRFEREELKRRITERLQHRLESGMVDEVKNLLFMNISYERLLSLGLEYKFIAMHIKGELAYNDMFQKLNSAIHDFAKRQMTWYRKMEREGVTINWVDNGDYEKASVIVSKFLEHES